MDVKEDQIVLTPVEGLSDLAELRDLYFANWPENCIHYYCLNTFLRWLHLLKVVDNLKIYTLSETWKENGIYIIVDRYQLFTGALNSSWNPLLEKGLSLLDWKNGFKVSSLHQRHRDPVLNVIKQKNLEIEYDSHTVMYFLPKEEASNFKNEVPQGYYFQMLSENDADTVNDLWPNKHQGSAFFIRRQIALDISIGLYQSETHELVAWCLRLQGGFAGALQVKDSFKRKGFGTLVLKEFADILADLHQDVMALVNDDNVASKAMFEKVGFKLTDACYWIRTFPTKEGSEWPDNI